MKIKSTSLVCQKRDFCKGRARGQGKRKNLQARDVLISSARSIAGDARLLPIVVEESQVGQQDAEEDLVNRECPQSNGSGKENASPSGNFPSLGSEEVSQNLSAVQRQNGKQVEDRQKEVDHQQKESEPPDVLLRRWRNGLDEQKGGYCKGETGGRSGGDDGDMLPAGKPRARKSGEASQTVQMNDGEGAILPPDKCVAELVD